MPSLKQINKDHTPHLFFSGKDQEGVWTETEHIECLGGIRLRKRCLGGWQDIELKEGKLTLYFLPELTVINVDDTIDTVPGIESVVAEGYLVPQKLDWELNDWVNIDFNIDTDVISEILDPVETNYDAISTFDNGIERVEVFFQWSIGKSKQTYRIHAPVNERVRMTAYVTDYKNCPESIIKDFRDFLGLTLVDTLVDDEIHEVVRYVFESDGFELTESDPYFEIDPYLVIDEPSGYITVACDGFGLRFLDSTIADFLQVMDETFSTDWGDFTSSLYVGSTWYNFNAASTSTYTILQSTPTCVKIQMDGVYSGGITNLDKSVLIFTIYPDRFFVEFKFTVSSTGFTLDESYAYSSFRWDADAASNFNAVYESAGSEVNAVVSTNYALSTYDYIAFTADEHNFQMVIVDYDIQGTSVPAYRFHYGENRPAFNFLSGTITAGISTITVACILDSAEREGGKQYDGSLVASNILVNDDFSSDTSADYTSINGTLSISAGKAYGLTAWQRNFFWHETTTGGPNHWVKGSCIFDGTNGSGLLFRVNVTTGYMVFLSATALSLRSFSGATTTFVSSIAHSFVTDQEYTILIKAIGTVFQCYIDGEYIGSLTDSTYATGNYCGILMDKGSNGDPTVDNFSCGIFSADNRLEQGIQYTDPDDLTFTSGTPMTSGTGTTSIGADGFDASGAYNIACTSGSDVINYSLGDNTQHKQALVIHDFPFTSGDPDDPTVYSRLFWDCKNSAPSVYSATDGNTVTLNGATISNDGLLVELGDYPSFPCTDGNNINFDKGCISFEYTRMGAPDAYAMFFSADTYTEFCLYLYITISDDRYAFYWDGTRVSFNLTSDFPVGEKFKVQLKYEKGEIPELRVNNQVAYGVNWGDNSTPEAIGTGTPTISNLTIGSGSGYEINGLLNNFFITDDIIFDYGAYFTGNHHEDLSDIALAHEDILFYWDCESNNSIIPDTPLVGSNTSVDYSITQTVLGTYSALFNTGTDVISFDISGGNVASIAEGQISFWMYCSAFGTYYSICGISTASANEYLAFSVWTSTTDFILRRYLNVGNDTYVSGTLPSVNVWHHYRLVCSESQNRLEVWIDGVLESGALSASMGTSAQAEQALIFGDTELPSAGTGIGSNTTYFDQVFITNNPNTPQIPTANGIPLHAPVRGDA